MKRMLSFLVAATLCIAAQASVTIHNVAGWFESGYVTWSEVTGATHYDVYISADGTDNWTKLDRELVRRYPDYLRADAVGLKAGNYQFKVVPVNADGEMSSEATISSPFLVTAHDRAGFAHVDMDEGIGAYKNDGTLKEGAKVIYVWAENAKTVRCEMQTSNAASETRTGLQNIIQALEKSVTNRTPLAVRIIGTIKAEDMDYFGSSAEGLQVKGKSSSYKGNVTIEGIGNDANIYGFGILCRSISSVEFRNFGIMLCMDDCLSLDTDNKHVWVHNMDFFYGKTGGDADQAKGDGTVDIKGKSSHVTVSYNHFFDSGKCSLGGMKSETTDCWMSYHHNWFDHSDSRHPRIRTAFYHVYNNYFDGNAKYGVGVTMGGSAFVEGNYFRNCKYPMLISKQGTDAQGDGTFSGESGGVIKAFNNTIIGAKQILYYDGTQTDGKWDAVKTNSRDEEVTATAYSGGSEYNNQATTAAISAVTDIEDPATVPTTVTGNLGAGRLEHGDFAWTFDNATEDTNYNVITALKNALQNYQSSLVGFAGGTSSGGGTDPVDPDQPGGGDTPEPTGPKEVCHFTGNTPSLSYVKLVTGNYSNSKGTVTYEGQDYSICIKMESATNVAITPVKDCTVTLVFDQASKRLKIDGTEQHTDANNQYTFSATKNQKYTLTKGDSMNLFLVIFSYPEDSEDLHAISLDTRNLPIYNLQGQVVPDLYSPGIYVVGGKKVFLLPTM